MTRALLCLMLAAMTAPTLLAQTTSPDLSDAEVAHVAVTANTIDIDAAQFAQVRSHNDQVRAFAATMIRDHSAVNEQASALATRLHVTPKDNTVSQSLVSGATDAHKVIEAAQGAAFDRAYMDREIGYHQAVLDALDNLLIPTTENAELRKLLVDVRPAFAAHLEHAKQVRAGLGAAR
jgi:putative membrane protein